MSQSLLISERYLDYLDLSVAERPRVMYMAPQLMSVFIRLAIEHNFCGELINYLSPDHCSTLMSDTTIPYSQDSPISSLVPLLIDSGFTFDRPYTLLTYLSQNHWISVIIRLNIIKSKHSDIFVPDQEISCVFLDHNRNQLDNDIEDFEQEFVLNFKTLLETCWSVNYPTRGELQIELAHFVIYHPILPLVPESVFDSLYMIHLIESFLSSLHTNYELSIEPSAEDVCVFAPPNYVTSIDLLRDYASRFRLNCLLGRVDIVTQ